MTAVGSDGAPPLRVAYIMSRFPKLTETFVLHEMLAVERRGVAVELFPLLREPAPTMHAEATALVGRARYLPFLSRPILRTNLRMLQRRPRAYLGALATLIRATLGSANYLGGGLGIFPKTVHAAALMERLGVEHVHAHFANHPTAAAFIVHRLTGIPYSFTAHGSDLHVDHHMLREKTTEAAFVAAISEDNRREILDVAGPGAADRVVVIHCGVDAEVFHPPGPTPATGNGPAPATDDPAAGSGTTSVSRPPRPLRITAIGTLHEVKGQAYLVDACRLLLGRGVRVECRLVGEGEDHAMLERRISSAGLDDVVHLLGRRTQDEVAALLADTDVLVAPSVPTRGGKREGIPVVLMEAMASEVCVVASRLSGIPELVEDGVCGLLAPPRDAKALADALERLAVDPALRARLAAAGRDKVVREFDVDRNAAILVARFAAVVAAVDGRGVRTARRPDVRGLTA
jgi:colanic acid/amylovoran biosynthesis glycosyltransferase